jgi:hypothetical protein
MPLSDIVNVQISRQTQSVSEAGFGTPMILGTFKNWNDLIRQYSSIAEVAADFSPSQLEYIAAQDIFSQPITPPYIYIGRRTVDTVSVDVETALPGFNYTTTINGTNVTIPSTTSVQQSVLTLSGIVTWIITFSGDFTSSLTGVVVNVNNQPSASVPWTTNQADTLTAIAAAIDALGFTTSTPGTDSITVVFNSPSTSSIINGISISGAGQPTLSSLTQDGPLVASNSIAVSVNGTPLSGSPFTFATSSLVTLTTIATAIQTALNIGYSPGVADVDIGGPNNNVITVTSNPNQAGLITHFVVTAGASQATAAIVNTTQPTTNITIANAMATAITNAALGVSSTDNGAGQYSIVANVSGVPYTVSVSVANLVAVNQARVTITQAIPNQAYTVIIQGTPFTYQAPYNVTSNDQISSALVTLINASPLAVPVTASDNSNGSFEIISNDNTYLFVVQVNPFEAMLVQTGLIIGPYTPSAGVVDDLVAIQNVNDGWYALACTDRTSVTVQAIAAWIETQLKIFGTASNDANIINLPPGTGSGFDSTSIAYILFNAGYARSFVMYHQDANEDYPECAWFGNCLPLQPGSETWAFKTLNSIPYTDVSSTQQANAFAKNANLYQYIGGVGITQNGTVAVGEYIDIIRGVDWLTSTIQSYVYSILVSNPKVPYTDQGITAVESEIRAVLELGIANNFIAANPPYIITVPLAANVSSIDKANRILRNVIFQATLAGAIQAVDITGTVSV